MQKAFFVVAVLCVVSARAEIDFISGQYPDQRPNVPKVTETKKLSAKESLHGVTGEVPPSLQKAIDSQGAWYTPLTQPGMLGPYDIRKYHTPADQKKAETYLKKQWDPIHFKPKIDQATDQQCLACHQEIMNHQPKDQSQAGVKSENVIAWYQTLDTYTGKQEDMHWRHLQSPYAKRVTQFKCTTCHQGNDPREEAMVPADSKGTAGFTLRKGVHPETCLMCHGQFPDPKIMNLPATWTKIRDSMQNNCLSCHQVFRTHRHQVNFLKPEEIEKAGKESGDSCFGCHGGRAWYRISYNYPRHDWPGMPPVAPGWAKNKPKESEQRFLIDLIKNEKNKESK